MAKRVRGQRASHRIGGPAAQRRSSEPSVSRLAAPVDPPDVDAAIDSILLEEPALTLAEPVAPAPPSGRPRRGTKVRSDSLQARIEAENVYVHEDLRRILVVSVILFAALAACWFVFVFLNVLDLY